MQDPAVENPSLPPAGIGFAVACYSVWGLVPIYWKAVAAIPAAQVLIPRVFWTGLLLVALTRVTRRQSETWDLDLRGWIWTLGAALLLSGNWGIFIYAIQTDRVIATSLGYYITPLTSIVLGLLVVGERLNRIQTVAVAIAALGVTLMALQAGALPWISLVLAGSFSLYGLIHKLFPQPPFAGLLREMFVLSPFALGGLAWLSVHPSNAPGIIDASFEMHALLALTGVVTAVPLLLFHAATRRLPLIAVGMFQYIAPTITLALAVVVFREHFSMAHAVGFGCVWIGLSVFTLDSLRRIRSLARVS